MDKQKLEELYTQRGYSAEKTEQAIDAVLNLEKYLNASDASLESCTVGNIKKYIAHLLNNNKIDMDTVLAMARYFYLENRHDIYIYFTKLLGGLGVLENIKRRTEKYAGKDAADKVFKGFSFPPLGTPIEEVPDYTKDLMRRIEKNLSTDLYKRILAGNNHGVQKEGMQAEKEFSKNPKIWSNT